MSHVLITGGAGFIGSRLATALVSRGHQVRVLDPLAPQVHGDDPARSPLFLSLPAAVDFHRGSVTSREDLRRALPGCDVVVHLAAETGTGQSMYAIEHYTGVNVGGTALLLDVIANECRDGQGACTVRRLVVASSRAVCGEGKYRCGTHGFVFPGPRTEADMAGGLFEVRCPDCGAPAAFVPTDEMTPVRPSSVYGITKLAQEQMVLTVARSLGISGVAFRYQNVYGPGQSLSNPYTGILSIFSTRILHGRGLRVFEDGDESRDFVYIDDVVDVTRRAIESEHPLLDVFNVGSGVATSVATIARTLCDLLGCQVPIEVTGEFRVGDIRHNVADLTKVHRALGFAPSVPLAEGLGRFVAWVQGEGPQVDRYEQSLEELRVKGLFK